MRPLKVLEDVRIASPCNADWDDMKGDERVRFCARCEKNVYNLSAMPRAEAERFVRADESGRCLRFYRRSDGTVLTADCPVGARRLRLRARVWARVSGAAASLALLFGLAAGRARADASVSDGKQQPPQKIQPPLMGAPPRRPDPPKKPDPKPPAVETMGGEG